MLINYFVRRNVSLEHEILPLREVKADEKQSCKHNAVLQKHGNSFLFPIFPGIFSSAFETVG